jgi:hypothetical protein
MSSDHAARPPIWSIAGIDFRNLIWVAIALGVMVVAIAIEVGWLLRFVHIASGVLLTGADILLGFLIGPIIRRLDFAARRDFSLRMLPKTLFIMTTLGIIAPTSGWYLAVELGFLDLDYPEFWWVVAALTIAAVLALQGLAVLLPTNIRAYLEMRKDQPDAARVERIMRLYFYTVASQGVMQVLMVIVMTRFAAGV